MSLITINTEEFEAFVSDSVNNFLAPLSDKLNRIDDFITGFEQKVLQVAQIEDSLRSFIASELENFSSFAVIDSIRATCTAELTSLMNSLTAEFQDELASVLAQLNPATVLATVEEQVQVAIGNGIAQLGDISGLLSAQLESRLDALDLPTATELTAIVDEVREALSTVTNATQGVQELLAIATQQVTVAVTDALLSLDLAPTVRELLPSLLNSEAVLKALDGYVGGLLSKAKTDINNVANMVVSMQTSVSNQAAQAMSAVSALTGLVESLPNLVDTIGDEIRNYVNNILPNLGTQLLNTIINQLGLSL